MYLQPLWLIIYFDLFLSSHLVFPHGLHSFFLLFSLSPVGSIRLFFPSPPCSHHLFGSSVFYFTFLEVIFRFSHAHWAQRSLCLMTISLPLPHSVGTLEGVSSALSVFLPGLRMSAVVQHSRQSPRWFWDSRIPRSTHMLTFVFSSLLLYLTPSFWPQSLPFRNTSFSSFSVRVPEW